MNLVQWPKFLWTSHLTEYYYYTCYEGQPPNLTHATAWSISFNYINIHWLTKKFLLTFIKVITIINSQKNNFNTIL